MEPWEYVKDVPVGRGLGDEVDVARHTLPDSSRFSKKRVETVL